MVALFAVWVRHILKSGKYDIRRSALHNKSTLYSIDFFAAAIGLVMAISLVIAVLFTVVILIVGIFKLYKVLFGRREPASNNVFVDQTEMLRGGDDLYHLEISFLDGIRGATKTVHLLGRPPVNINVPPGIASGYTVRVPGGGADRGDGVRADALIEIKVKPHPRFERRGLDICLDVWVSAQDLAAGATIEVPTLDGYAKVRIPKGAMSGQILRLQGNGILCAKSGSIGHQFVRIMAGEEAARPRETADPWQTAHAEQSAASYQTAEPRKAQSQPHSGQTDAAIETEFKTVFFSRTSADRERIISHWMQKKDVNRAEAMRLAVEDWRKDTRAGR